MARLNVDLDDTFYSHLKDLPGTISQNVRVALYEYVEKAHSLYISASQSKRKGSDSDEK